MPDPLRGRKLAARQGLLNSINAAAAAPVEPGMFSITPEPAASVDCVSLWPNFLPLSVVSTLKPFQIKSEWHYPRNCPFPSTMGRWTETAIVQRLHKIGAPKVPTSFIVCLWSLFYLLVCERFFPFWVLLSSSVGYRIRCWPWHAYFFSGMNDCNLHRIALLKCVLGMHWNLKEIFGILMAQVLYKGSWKPYIDHKTFFLKPTSML